MKKILFVAFFAICFFCENTYAEEVPVEFGKISDTEINMEEYALDSNANAVIICDFGQSYFDLDDHRRFQYVFKRNLRIKILKKEGYNRARHTFLVRQHVDFYDLKASTYNLENGKLKATALDKSQVYKDKYNYYMDIYKFEMPEVKVGSIIDIEYELRYYTLGIKDWDFQSTIPAIHSEYRVSVPEYFVYKQLEKGYFPIGSKTEDKRTAHDATHFSFLDYSVTDYVYKSENIPAFQDEDYSTSASNYLSSIQFEIAKAFPYNGPIEDFSNSWEAIGKNLMFDSDFGGRTRGISPLRKHIRYLDSLNLSPQEKLNGIYQYIQKEMNWNGMNGFYSYTPAKAWDEHKGSCADINLMLVQALKKLDFDAYPVILSTRDNGFIHPAQMMVEQFNYVIAAVKTEDGKIIFLDATDKHLPVGILPERCLNFQGRLIEKKGGEWVEINPITQHRTTIKAQLKLTDNDEITGSVSENYMGYAAIEKRNKLDYYNNYKDYLKEYSRSFNKLLLEGDTILNRKENDKNLAINYSVSSSDWLEKNGNLIAFNPLIINELNTNPFKLDERFYPVDYSFLKANTYIASIEIPEGYSVEQIPESKNMVLPGRIASYTQSVSQSGNVITIMSKFNINRITFLPEVYKDLQMFYNQVIDAQSKQIILKKI